jgi:hypothetical protein
MVQKFQVKQPVSDVHCVGLHCRAEVFSLASDAQASSCDQPDAIVAGCRSMCSIDYCAPKHEF